MVLQEGSSFGEYSDKKKNKENVVIVCHKVCEACIISHQTMKDILSLFFFFLLN